MARQDHIRTSIDRMIHDNKKDKILKKLGNAIMFGDIEEAEVMLDTLKNKEKQKWLLVYHNPNYEGETLLHLAVKYHDNEKIVRKLSELCPDLLLKQRRGSVEFKGQTALHIAITKGNIEAIKVMLKVDNFGEEIALTNLLHIPATGSRFVNTVMMGQLPLTVAALKGNADIVDILLSHGANFLTRNKEGDTVFHSIVKYAATYPEKVVEMVTMLQHLNKKVEEKNLTERSMYDYSRTDRDQKPHLSEHSRTDMYRQPYSFVWFLKNIDSMTPLQLAAKLGVTELFEEILNIKDVYCFISANDGLFDVKQYDITEIDTVSNIRSLRNRHPSSVNNKKSPADHVEGIAKQVVHCYDTQCASCWGQCSLNPERESILEMLFQMDYNNKDAYRIIEMSPVKNIIKRKWSKYQWIVILWMTLHYIFMITLTVYSVYNVEFNIHSGEFDRNATDLSVGFVRSFRWVSFTVGILYGVVAICLLRAKFRKKDMLAYFLHNLEYIIPMLILSVTMIVDVLWTIAEQHDNIPLVLALLCGWWLNIFFLSAIKHFSFFTEMIKRVIIGDLFRFGLVILFGLFSFTAAMYMVFRRSEELQGDFTSYGSTMMAMFKLGIGMEDISALYSARLPWAAVLIFVLYTIFTYLLMLNALIAMMSQTCSLVLEERFPQWRVQQLSVILFIEDILCNCCFQNIISCAGTKKITRGYDPSEKQETEEYRYFLEIHSLHMEYATDEDKVCAKKKSNDMQTLHPPHSQSGIPTAKENPDLEFSTLPVDANISQIGTYDPEKSPFENTGSDNTQPSVCQKPSAKEKKRRPLEKEDEMNTVEGEEEKAQYIRQVLPRSQEVLSEKRPTRKRTAKSQQRTYLYENDKELRSQGVQHPPVEIDTTSVRVNLARVSPKGPKDIEYEIRDLVDS